MKLKFIIHGKPVGVVIRSIGQSYLELYIKTSPQFFSFILFCCFGHAPHRMCPFAQRTIPSSCLGLSSPTEHKSLKSSVTSARIVTLIRDKYLISEFSEHLIFLQLHPHGLGHSSQSLIPKLCDSEWLIAMNLAANCFKSKLVASKVCTIWARFLLTHLLGFGLFVLVEWLSGFLFVFPVQDVWNYVRSVLQPNRANVLGIALSFHPRKV